MSEHRPIPGAPGYWISREGEVIGKRGRRLAIFTDPCGGGPKVSLNFEGRHTSKSIAGLVALAWDPEPEPERPSGLDIEALRARVARLEAVVSPEAARAATRREIKRLQAELEELG